MLLSLSVCSASSPTSEIPSSRDWPLSSADEEEEDFMRLQLLFLIVSKTWQKEKFDFYRFQFSLVWLGVSSGWSSHEMLLSLIRMHCGPSWDKVRIPPPPGM